MAEAVAEARNLTRLIGSRIEGSSIWLAFERTDGAKFGIQLSPEAAAASIAAILTNLGSLRTKLEERTPQPTLQSSTLGLAMSPEGGVGLQLTLQGGTQLVVQLASRDELSTLRSLIDDAIALLEPKKH